MEQINHPSHYNTSSKVECIDAVQACVEQMTGEEAFLAGNAIKYIWRFKHKGKPIEDIQKAIWYLNRLIDVEIDKGETI